MPAQDWAAWIATCGFPATLAPPLLLVLLFPTGRLASRLWRIVAALIAVGAVAVAVGNAFTPRVIEYPSVRNPVGVEWFAGSLLDSGGIGWFPLLVGAVAAGVGLVPRLWQSGARAGPVRALQARRARSELPGLRWLSG